jgi:uncharacterized protein YbjT (DUF2867 family)
MILVAGATGSLGGVIVRGLRERGESVRALARCGSNHAPLGQASVHVVLGDLKDPESLERACQGVTAVITTASATTRGDDSVENVDLKGTVNLIDAAKHAGVQHFTFVSTIGASPESPIPVFRAKGSAEQHLRESGLAWTVLQPAAFMDVWFGMMIEMPAFSGQPVTLVGESLHRHSFIAVKDVAEFAIASLTNPAARNATLVIGGPEAITFRAAVQAYEEAAGRPFQIRSVAPGEPIPGLPEPVWGLAAALESYDTVIPMEDTARTFGVAMTGVSDFARSRVTQAAAA